MGNAVGQFERGKTGSSDPTTSEGGDWGEKEEMCSFDQADAPNPGREEANDGREYSLLG
jgi:hypothetical protein